MPHGDAVGVLLILLGFLVSVSKLRKVKVGDYEKLLVVPDGFCRADTGVMRKAFCALGCAWQRQFGRIVSRKKVTSIHIDVSRAELDLRRWKFTQVAPKNFSV